MTSVRHVLISLPYICLRDNDSLKTNGKMLKNRQRQVWTLLSSKLKVKPDDEFDFYKAELSDDWPVEEIGLENFFNKLLHFLDICA